jgi:hypothetical protein
MRARATSVCLVRRGISARAKSKKTDKNSN